MASIYPLFKWAYFILLILPSPAQSCDLTNLKALQSSSIWNNNSNPHLLNTSCCQWPGVSCNSPSSNRVTDLHLSNLSLVGPIPPSISNLTLLQSLDLSLNSVTGPLPAHLTSFSHLQTLNLSYNRLSGPVRSKFRIFNLLGLSKHGGEQGEEEVEGVVVCGRGERERVMFVKMVVPIPEGGALKSISLVWPGQRRRRGWGLGVGGGEATARKRVGNVEGRERRREVRRSERIGKRRWEKRW